jgi:membrane protein implicated in regulation of membrane protease activity
MDLTSLLQAVFLLMVLLCPLSIVAIAGWAAWSRRQSRAHDETGSRSVAVDGEISRLRSGTAEFEPPTDSGR